MLSAHCYWCIQAKLALSLEQSAKIISLRMGFLERRHQARRRLTSLPSRVQAFVLDQPVSIAVSFSIQDLEVAAY